jgi:hypothetical protein
MTTTESASPHMFQMSHTPLALHRPRAAATLRSFALALLLAGGVLVGLQPSARAQAADGASHGGTEEHMKGMEEHMKGMQAHHEAMLKHALDAGAERLELKASQMPAWQAFSSAFIALHQHPAMGPMGMMGGDKQDAAAIVRDAADHAAEHARKLAAVADAAGKLQATMSDNQKTLFTGMVRQHIARMHHHHFGMHGHGHGHGDEDGDGEASGGEHREHPMMRE